jgi:tetraacyldisaccharide 4'-kinase
MVEADPDRLAGGRRLLAQPNPPDVFILDDGFQHRRLARDLNIVVLDATLDPADPLFRLLPRGLLREPAAAIRRADWVVITRADQAANVAVERLRRLVHDLDEKLPIATCRHAPVGLACGDSGLALDDLAGRDYLAFCGIGNPAAFRATLNTLPGQCVDFVSFDDHHAYTPAEIEAVARRAVSAGAELLLTTAKDLVKLSDAWTRLPIWALRVSIEWMDAAGERLRDDVLDLAGAGGPAPRT